jgi:hypothetical protein
VEDSGAIRQRTTVNRETGSVEKEEWRWCCRRPRKSTCSPDGKPCRKVYYRMVLTMLFHQTWLDERLFGWSKSANRGTSAWAGATRSQEISRAATPDLSEDEEVADYDNVLGYLPIYEGAPHGHNRIRSRQNSYADLQKLRMSAIGKGGRFDFLFEFMPSLPQIQVMRTETSKLIQVHWEKARGSTSVTVIANGRPPSPMASPLTASQQSTNKRSSRR